VIFHLPKIVWIISAAAVAGLWLGAGGWSRWLGDRPQPPEKTKVHESVRTVTVEVERRADGTTVERKVERSEARDTQVQKPSPPPVRKKHSVEVKTYVKPGELSKFRPERNVEVGVSRRVGNSDLHVVLSGRPTEHEVSVGVRWEF